MKRLRWLSTLAWWLLPVAYCLGVLGCAERRAAATAAEAWQPFVIRGFVLAKSYQPPHPEPRVVAGQVSVVQEPATWVLVVVTPLGALTFTANPAAYASFAERDPILVRGVVSADGKLVRVVAVARPGEVRPHTPGTAA